MIPRRRPLEPLERGRISRRTLLELLGVAFWTASGPSSAVAFSAFSASAGCASTPPHPPHPPHRSASSKAGAGRAAELWSFFDLPAADPRSRELSGIVWDARQSVLWAVHDARPDIIELVPDASLRTWSFGETITIEGGEPVDLEGIALLPDGFVVCSEHGPRLLELDRQGRFRRTLVVPSRFDDARKNKGFESLTISPSGRYLFTTTEVALERDGPAPSHAAGTRVRILRIDLQAGTDAPIELAYETDALPHEHGDWGVSDLEAVSDTELLVLERGWSRGHGNSVRIYQTSLDDRARCDHIEQLSRDATVLSKTLLVDLANLRADGVPEPKQPQPGPLLDNFEGLALGPRTRDDRPTLLLISDDNGHATQVARIVVLVL